MVIVVVTVVVIVIVMMVLKHGQHTQSPKDFKVEQNLMGAPARQESYKLRWGPPKTVVPMHPKNP